MARPWIDYIIANVSICDDFMKWTREAESTLNATLLKAIYDERMEEARGIAHEIKVYETLRKSIEGVLRERTSQAQYNEQIERRP